MVCIYWSMCENQGGYGTLCFHHIISCLYSTHFSLCFLLCPRIQRAVPVPLCYRRHRQMSYFVASTAAAVIFVSSRAV